MLFCVYPTTAVFTKLYGLMVGLFFVFYQIICCNKGHGRRDVARKDQLFRWESKFNIWVMVSLMPGASVIITSSHTTQPARSMLISLFHNSRQWSTSSLCWCWSPGWNYILSTWQLVWSLCVRSQTRTLLLPGWPWSRQEASWPRPSCGASPEASVRSWMRSQMRVSGRQWATHTNTHRIALSVHGVPDVKVQKNTLHHQTCT